MRPSAGKSAASRAISREEVSGIGVPAGIPLCFSIVSRSTTAPSEARSAMVLPAFAPTPSARFRSSEARAAEPESATCLARVQPPSSPEECASSEERAAEPAGGVPIWKRIWLISYADFAAASGFLNSGTSIFSTKVSAGPVGMTFSVMSQTPCIRLFESLSTKRS